VPPRLTSRFARLATFGRAAGLLNDFRFEQSDPDRFYGAMARDTAAMIAALSPDPLLGRVVLDVGGGPGYFADEFRRRGARYVSVEPDPTEMHAAGLPQRGSVRGSGTHLPLRDGVVDICYSSNVVEHVADPWRMCDEMIRVTRPGGLVVISYTLWFGPFGGHEMGLTHYAGGGRAARWYTRRHGHPPKNLYGTSLFRVTAADGLAWARTVDPRRARLVGSFPRYLPRWMWWVLRVPVLREVLATNLVLVLRRTDQ
jgi:SAM-dependent methyltransferase